jgi:hypothetical protein
MSDDDVTPDQLLPGKYRKKPVVIEAVQFLGSGRSCTIVTEFLGGPHDSGHRWKSNTYEGGWIVTLEGDMEFGPGDWIIRGVQGELYPCKPDIFAATYEPAAGPREDTP